MDVKRKNIQWKLIGFLIKSMGIFFAKYDYDFLKTVARILVTDKRTDGRTESRDRNTST